MEVLAFFVVSLFAADHANAAHLNAFSKRHGAELEKSESAEEIAQMCSRIRLGKYDMRMHIAGLFIILGVSALGVFTPMIIKRIKRMEVVSSLMTTLKFFGIGIIIGTTFIHMLVDAFESFASPCMPEFFQGYPWAPIFCLIAIVFIHLVQFILTEQARNSSVDSPRGSSIVNLTQVETATEKSLPIEVHHHHHVPYSGGGSNSKYIGTLVLELGLVLHSIVIGVSLGITSGKEYIGLLIAMAFHQFFEGVALGSRISEIPSSLCNSIILGAVFACTTPVGFAIGIGVRKSYSGNSGAGLAIQAIFDSLASGLLIYASFVELLASEVNMSEDFRRRSTIMKMCCFLAIYLGIVVMAILGHEGAEAQLDCVMLCERLENVEIIDLGPWSRITRLRVRFP
ncbi:uncharacterized protein VTP21DRAFT_1803 [Calcarisporiella thermophila]|uniref:uncharacterized protein n=1 Tax=Calcarisporiella thermophila TaxID=911321 RepID=UPI0037422C05